MSTVVMAANGSWGDVLPFVAVAHRLRMRGHHVEFVLPTSFHRRVGAEGFTVHDAEWQIGPDELAALERDWAHGGGVPMIRAVLRQLALPRLDDAYRALSSACDGKDMLVCHVNQVMGPIVASRTGIPLATLSLFPMLVPTTEGLPGTPLCRLPPWLRRPIGRPVLASLRAAAGPLFYDREFNRFRHQMGLPRHRAFFVTAGLSADRYLALFPPHFANRPSDWPAHVQLSGFCRWDSSHLPMPAEVERFIAAGEPPILVTMGTASSSGLTEMLQRVMTELDRSGHRALLLTGDPRHRTGALGDRDGVVDFAPLDRLLPRCRAIVHHGGYGTTVASLLAGIPAVTVSPMPDQLWYGRRVAALGAGIALPWRQRTRIGPAIEQVLGQRAYADAARRYAELAAGHDGVAATCDELEALL